MLLCRDQLTGNKLTINDASLSKQQQSIRDQNHAHSSRSKAKGGAVAENARIMKGDLVYIKSERSKNKGREMYLVVDIIDNTMASLQKLYGSTFQSRQFDIPLSRIFHVISPGSDMPGTAHVMDSSSSDEDWLPTSDATSEDSDDELDDEPDKDDVEDVLPRPSLSPRNSSLRRSNRRRRSPPGLDRKDWVTDKPGRSRR